MNLSITNYERVCERYGGCVYDSFVLFSNLCKYLCLSLLGSGRERVPFVLNI